MTSPTRTGPADWPLDTSRCPGWDQHDQATRDLATAVATETVWALSGRRFGLSTVVVRPCRHDPDRGTSWPSRWYPPTSGYGRPVWWRGGPGPSCSCASRWCEVSLAGPVHDVIEVRVDGQLVAPTAYVVHDRRWLVRVDGACWPGCQDLTAAPHELGAFVVTYRRGVPVSAGGRWASGQLACEIGKALVNDSTCRLPRRVQSLVRQGVQQTFLDPAALARDGMTGLPEVDQWLRAVNPNRLPRDSLVWSPDLTRGRRRTS